jgi:hypothetical protein
MHKFWTSLASRIGGSDIVDWWKFMSGGLRQHLKGWNANRGREARLHKDSVLAQIQSLDARADSNGLDSEGWAFRYHLEEQLLEIYRVEEDHWRKRGRVRWML